MDSCMLPRISALILNRFLIVNWSKGLKFHKGISVNELYYTFNKQKEICIIIIINKQNKILLLSLYFQGLK